MQNAASLPVPVLPLMICFRVTRFCNARCGFCLAPPDGGKHPDASSLKTRIHWLLHHGVKTIHFCGGEPTIHKSMAELIQYVSEQGGRSKMTTNGLLMPVELIGTLRHCRTEVKVSLHGDKEHHNNVVGLDAFDKTVNTIKNLLKEKVNTSIQTTIVSGHLDVADRMISFCLENGVKKVSFLPFIPRGSGFERKDEYGLSQTERKILRNQITGKRRKLSSRLDIRLLDFSTRPIHVVEPGGSIILEGASEGMDELLYQIPGA